MKTIKLTKAQYTSLRGELPTRHIACKPRTPDYGVSQYTKEISRSTYDIYCKNIKK